MERGRRLGVDVGTVRVGVSICDPDGILATPLTTVAGEDPQLVADLALEHDVKEVIVGLPVNLAGKEGPAAVNVRKYADKLAELISPIPIVLTDERMSTVAASRRLSERGVKGKRQRAVVDQAAAVEILQHWLDAQRRRT